MPRPFSAQTGYHGDLLGPAADPTVGKRVRMSKTAWHKHIRQRGMTEEQKEADNLTSRLAGEVLLQEMYEG